MPPPPARVTAVLVSHDGDRWLAEVVAAVAAQTVAPDTVLCADTGSRDASALTLRAAFGDVVPLPRSTGFGAAVAAALAQHPGTAAAGTDWVWLLHDDCAPDPGALAALLAFAGQHPSAALLGPKVVDWDEPKVLVEAGVSTDLAGRRYTGLEQREYDQGQRDESRDVLAVGTAGALVRRDVWDALGGLDPTFALFRDDLDLGWRVNAAGHRVVLVPAARVRHARAATTGRRVADAAPGRVTGTDREHALLVLLAHAPRTLLLPRALRLLVGCLLRTLLLLGGRRPREAWDELPPPVRWSAAPAGSRGSVARAAGHASARRARCGRCWPPAPSAGGRAPLRCRPAATPPGPARHPHRPGRGRCAPRCCWRAGWCC